jgi:hypothetical protein
MYRTMTMAFGLSLEDEVYPCRRFRKFQSQMLRFPVAPKARQKPIEECNTDLVDAISCLHVQGGMDCLGRGGGVVVEVRSGSCQVAFRDISGWIRNAM